MKMKRNKITTPSYAKSEQSITVPVSRLKELEKQASKALKPHELRTKSRITTVESLSKKKIAKVMQSLRLSGILVDTNDREYDADKMQHPFYEGHPWLKTDDEEIVKLLKGYEEQRQKYIDEYE
jgi:hypothetical protein